MNIFKHFWLLLPLLITNLFHQTNDMSENSNYLWNKILKVHEQIKTTEDALAKWEKSMLLKVLIRQLKEEMGESAYLNLLESSRHLLGLNSPQPEGQC